MYSIERNDNINEVYYEYHSFVWTNQKITILPFIHVFAALTFCETIIHKKVIQLIVKITQNIGAGLTVECSRRRPAI
jgi:hypothetical protein